MENSLQTARHTPWSSIPAARTAAGMVDWRYVLILTGITVILRLGAVLLVHAPGYMDVEYYTVGGQQLAAGHGFAEPFIWNYLDQPAGIPHPGFLYWMPLPSILAAAGLWLSGCAQPNCALPPFAAAQLLFALLSAALPALAYAVATSLGASRAQARLAGALAVFGGFFFPMWTLPESFAPYALFGGLSLWVAGLGISGRWPIPLAWLLAGLLAGLGHLARADGGLLVAAISLAMIGSTMRSRSAAGTWPHRFVYGVLFLLGYLAVMAPWMVRNLAVSGSPLGTAGLQTIFLGRYDDLFAYGRQFDWSNYWNGGLGNILASKVQATWENLQTVIAVDGLIFLAPFAAWGLWRRRHIAALRPFLVYAGLSFFALTFVFTFPGPRGGLFHSSAAWIPFIYAAGAMGLDEAVVAAGTRRRWRLATGRRVFTVAAVTLAAGLSLLLFYRQVSAWNQSDSVYTSIGRWLAQHGVRSEVVMVNNPPGFTYFTCLPSVVLPNGDLQTLGQVAKRYQVAYVVVDANRPPDLAALASGRSVPGWLEWQADFDSETRLFRVK